MVHDPYIRGLAFGLSLAVPVGPIGLLCIRRTLSHGQLTGFVTGLGAATADMCYGAVAAFGLSAISSSLVGARVWLQGLGGLFLAYLGVRIFLSRPTPGHATASPSGYLGAYLSTFLLTLANPMTIMAFAALLAGSGMLGHGLGRFAAFRLVVGVFSGSALWWLILSSGVALVRERLGQGALRLVNRLSGAALMVFAILILARLAA